jgi:hypothetical protein
MLSSNFSIRKVNSITEDLCGGSMVSTRVSHSTALLDSDLDLDLLSLLYWVRKFTG